MALAWIAPDQGFVKISVYFTSVNEPLGNGNKNGIGTLLRDDHGLKLWGAMGPMAGLEEAEALIWGFHTGMAQAIRMGKEKTHLETNNLFVFDTIRLQDQIIIEPELEEAMRQFNTLYNINFKENITERNLYLIPIDLNQSASYMARYGMEYMPSFVEALAVFGDLQHYFERDNGLYFPFELQPNFGGGEVIDPSPEMATQVYNVDLQEDIEEPQLAMVLFVPIFRIPDPKMGLLAEQVARDTMVLDNHNGVPVNIQPVNQHNIILNVNLNVNLNIEVNAMAHVIDKGKKKIMSEYSFNADGLLSANAIRVLDNGFLTSILRLFHKSMIDLEEQVFQGIYAKYLLQAVVDGTLNHLLSCINEAQNRKGIVIDNTMDGLNHINKDMMDAGKMRDPVMDLMDVEHVLLEWAMCEEFELANS